MLLVDDLLLAPLTGLLWVFRKIHDAAQEEMLGEADAITQELRDLYMMLETGRITEAEFDARERALLDRLEVIQARGSGPGAADTDEDAEASEGEGDDEDAREDG
ncbi:MAG TPA: gas vesicle protein GvpG [Candidatus Rokubacteria bacterium]|nr:MAG: hypothetical protein A2X53_19050 [Candidatus Rokubacteria bacterium GWA2_70_23]OGK88831.1 MAG: hypothetical protein A2X50_11885 [Candidatus Rokubacteria bacterium GWF2_70_14]HAM60019.1 gas vesicle protein GvpG [Candidatus Rokubacteria bacterium]